MAWVLFITLSLKFSISAWTGIVSPGANPVRGRFTVEESGPEVQHKHPNVFELLRVTGSFMECIWFKSTRALMVINCFVFLSKVKNPFLSSFASIRYLLWIVVEIWLLKICGKYYINVRCDTIQILSFRYLTFPCFPSKEHGKLLGSWKENGYSWLPGKTLPLWRRCFVLEWYFKSYWNMK